MNSSTTETSTEELVDIIKQHLNSARNGVLDIIMTELHYNKEEALKIEDNVHTSTTSAMREIYTFKGSKYDFGSRRDFYHDIEIVYPDFANWSWICYNIMYYQSIGDTIGYYNGKWEFNHGNIHEDSSYVNNMWYEFVHLGGINDFQIKHLKASDDTIMYLSTLQVIINNFDSIDDFGEKLKQAYISSLPLLSERHPGNTVINSLEIQKSVKWDSLSYDKKAIGSGSCMRSGSIGIFYAGLANRERLIELSVESSRITHNSATAILGSITAALFTAYAVERVPINRWASKLLKLLKSSKIDNYMKQSRPDQFDDFMRDKIVFVGQWEKYIDLLFSGSTPKLDIKMMINGVLRFKYLSDNFSKGCYIPGACADDSLIMAYDSLIRCTGSIEKLLFYSILHPGDSDTVGSIAFSWFGAYYGSPANDKIVDRYKKDLEFKSTMKKCFNKMVVSLSKVYFYDIYMSTAVKYLRAWI